MLLTDLQRFWLYSSILIILFAGCSTLPFSGSPDEASPRRMANVKGLESLGMEVGENISADSTYASLISPYKHRVDSIMNVVLGKASAPLTEAKPESSLGNFAADAVRIAAGNMLGKNIDLCILNYGGLRIDLNKGPITVGNIFELMPFENEMVVLRLTGDQVRNLLNEVVKAGGEPISGARLRSFDDRAVDVIVGAQPIRNDQNYWIATSDYLQNGGGNMPTLWNADSVIYTDLKIRDALIQYVESRGNIEANIDGRFRTGG